MSTDDPPRCYDASGNQDVTMHPCSTDGSLLQCCSGGSVCATNGLCVNIDRGDLNVPYSWATCTVRDWSEKCGPKDPCYTIGSGVSGCEGLPPGYFACFENGVGFNCTSTDSPYVFQRDPVVFGASLLADGSIASATSTGGSPTSSSSSPTSTTQSSQASQEAKASASSNGGAIPLGVGLGVGLPLTAAILLGFLFFVRRRQRKAGYFTDRSAANPNTKPENANADWRKPELADDQKPNELAGSHRQPEMAADNNKDDRNSRAELS